jgi:hypothetical protein
MAAMATAARAVVRFHTAERCLSLPGDEVFDALKFMVLPILRGRLPILRLAKSAATPRIALIRKPNAGRG